MKIGVLMGGTSGEREVSLRSGKLVHESLQRQGFDSVAIDVGEDPVTAIMGAGLDIAFVILHGRGGEDGTIQGILEHLEIPYTGSGVLASALSMNKIYSKKLLDAEDILTPEFLFLDPAWDVERVISEVRQRFDYPIVLKPVNEGSSLGVVILHDVNEFRSCLGAEREKYQALFVERYIEGKCITVGVLGTGTRLRALPVLELVPRNEFYDYEAKYTSGMTEFICPALLEEKVYTGAQDAAVRTHTALGLCGFSRVDMQIAYDGRVFVLEANSIPGMTDLSDLPAEARACGITYDQLVYEILTSAYERKI